MKVFVSYRRNDSRDFAGRFADRLKQCPEITDVFMDIDAIAPGADFEARIATAVKQCDVFFAVIGPHWTGASERNAPRIFDKKDFVYRELRLALEAGRKVMPVLANDATMPAGDDLPAEVRSVVRINAFAIGHASFDRDFAALLGALGVRAKRGRSPLELAVRGGIGALAGIAGLIGVGAIHQAASGMSLSTRLGSDALVWFVIVGVVIASTATALRL